MAAAATTVVRMERRRLCTVQSLSGRLRAGSAPCLMIQDEHRASGHERRDGRHATGKSATKGDGESSPVPSGTDKPVGAPNPEATPDRRRPGPEPMPELVAAPAAQHRAVLYASYLLGSRAPTASGLSAFMPTELAVPGCEPHPEPRSRQRSEASGDSTLRRAVATFTSRRPAWLRFCRSAARPPRRSSLQSCDPPPECVNKR